MAGDPILGWSRVPCTCSPYPNDGPDRDCRAHRYLERRLGGRCWCGAVGWPPRDGGCKACRPSLLDLEDEGPF